MEQYPKLHLNSHHHNQQMGHPKRMLPGLVVHSTLWRRRRSQASAHRKWLPSSAHVRIVIELFFSLFYQATITSRFPTWLHLHFTHWQENAFSGTIDQAEPQLMRTNPQSEFLRIVSPWIEEVQSVARTGNLMDHDQCIGETSRKLYVLIYFW